MAVHLVPRGSSRRCRSRAAEPADEAWAESWLLPGEVELWRRMSEPRPAPLVPGRPALRRPPPGGDAGRDRRRPAPRRRQGRVRPRHVGPRRRPADRRPHRAASALYHDHERIGARAGRRRRLRPGHRRPDRRTRARPSPTLHACDRACADATAVLTNAARRRRRRAMCAVRRWLTTARRTIHTVRPAQMPAMPSSGYASTSAPSGATASR